VTHRPERRTNQALRRRIDQLIGRVRSAREEIVERGLDAVQETKDADGATPDADGAVRHTDDAASRSNGAARTHAPDRRDATP
jgi:hypothetical protein